MSYKSESRRDFLAKMGVLAPGAFLLTEPLWANAAEVKKEETEVGPAEDLMREHGGLNRILLIYEEGQRRIKDKRDFDPSSLKKSAILIRNFIEDYHEKLEEEFIFPRMKKLGKLLELVATLEMQHKAGRGLTVAIEQLSNVSALKNETNRAKLSSALDSFIRMYRPHESREDTILFPAFHESMNEKEYDELGEKFEEREHKLFGEEGFGSVVHEIEAIEKSLGIYDLSQFTPKV